MEKVSTKKFSEKKNSKKRKVKKRKKKKYNVNKNIKQIRFVYLFKKSVFGVTRSHEEIL